MKTGWSILSLALAALLLAGCALLSHYTPPPRCNEVRLGDLDGDGDLDAVLGNGPGNTDYGGEPNHVWVNDGGGAFADAGVRLRAPDRAFDVTRSVALGDLDGDGDPDLLFGNAISSPSTVWLNNGAGALSLHGQVYLALQMEIGYAQSESVRLGDLDGDGDLDLYVGNCCRSQWMIFDDGATLAGYADSPNMVWWNDGAGRYTDSGQRLGNWATGAVALGDLDGDGDLDAYEATQGGGPRAEPDDPRDPRDLVWLNDGAGRYTDSMQRLCPSNGRGAALGDLDGDGDLDVFVGNAHVGPEDQVWLNDGAARFTDSGQRLGDADTRVVLLGDVDGDGDLDAYAGHDEGGQIWFNDGAAHFGSGPDWTWDKKYASTLGDVDGDGDLDVLTARPEGRAIVWRNDGSGAFSK